MSGASDAATTSGSFEAGSPVRFALVAESTRPAHPTELPRHDMGWHAHAYSACPPCDLWQPRRAGAATSSVSGPGQNRSARLEARGDSVAQLIDHLREIGRNQRHGAAGLPTFDANRRRTALGIERIDGETVQRIGRKGDNAAVSDRPTRHARAHSRSGAAASTTSRSMSSGADRERGATP